MRDAEERAWEVVRRAYDERPQAPSHVGRAARTMVLRIGVFAAAALVVAVVSSPGQAVFKRFREAVGVKNAAPALFALPAPGRLLVQSAEHGGVWVVRADGLKRKIGNYEDAAWSPHGRFIVGTEKNELVALDPQGNVRWTLARHQVSGPAWEGTNLDTRIAYLSATGLRVVAGDGTGDHLLDAYTQGPFAWDPARLHTIAYYSGGAILLRTAEGKLLWRTPITVQPTLFSWSTDGHYLAVFSSKRIVVLSAHGRIVRTVSMLSGDTLTGAFAPDSHRLAVELRFAAHSEVRLVDVDHPGNARLVFAGPGDFGQLAWSPNGKWLLVDWPAANQWVFLHGTHVHAVANIRQEFPRVDHLGPMLEVAGRWCCAG